jgi:sugar phosphate isomerase/epimerase
MDRRQFLKLGAITAAGGVLVRDGFAQGAGAAPAARFPLDVFSRHLQWCRAPQELAKAVADIGLTSVDLTVLPRPGHVDPASVKTELPVFVNGLKSAGISVSCITCDIRDADSPNAENILGAASSAGIHYYSWTGFTYTSDQPYSKQLDAIKPRVEKLAKLNEKYRMKALYQPQAGSANVGSVFVDFLEVLQNFDPRFVAFRYDTASLLQTSPEAVVTHLRLGAPYIGGLALNDAVVRLDLPVWKEGKFEGPPELLTRPNGGGDNTGNAGGDPMAYGGGGRPLPYHVHPVQVGTGMIDLISLSKTLKEINFNGPAECQVKWDLGGAELGNDRITLPRQRVIGLLKRDRLIVEQGFQTAWNLKVLKPPFMERRSAPSGQEQPE